MTAHRVLASLDRWGLVLLVYLLPWQARWIYLSGELASAPSESRTVSIAAVEVLIALLLIVRVLAAGTHPRARERGVDRVLVAFGAIVLLALFSIIISADRMASVVALIHLLFGLAVFYLIITSAHDRDLRIAFVTSACVEAGMAIAQISFQRIYPSTAFGLSAHYPEMPGTSVVEANGMRLLRAYGTFPHPNILGGFLAIAILSARRLFHRFSFFAAGVCALLTVGLFLSFSRLAWIAALAGLIVAAIVERKNRINWKIVVVCAAVIAIMSAFFSPFVLARVHATGRLEMKSVATRISSLRDAQALYGLHPLTGVGVGAFTIAVANEIDTERNGYDIEPAHSAPLVVLAELGIFGFGLFLLLLYYCFRESIAAGSAGAAAALVILAAGDHWAWTTLAGVLIFWAGWALALRRQS